MALKTVFTVYIPYWKKLIFSLLREIPAKTPDVQEMKESLGNFKLKWDAERQGDEKVLSIKEVLGKNMKDAKHPWEKGHPGDAGDS